MWTPAKVQQYLLWTPYGVYMNSLQNPYILQESMWSPYKLQESIWILQEVCLKYLILFENSHKHYHL